MAARSRTKFWILFIIIAAGAYYLYGRFMPHGGGAAAGGSGPVPVSVAQVEERPVQQWSEFSGRLVAVNQAEIRPRVSGTIDAIHFKEGETVKKGAPLFTIDPRPYQAALQAAQARAAFAESQLGRADALMKDKAIPQREFDQRKNEASVARADYVTAKLNLDYTHIVSPITGKAGRAEITVGNLVEAGGSAPVLTTVVSNTPIYADFEIDEDTYLRYVKSDGINHVKQIPVTMGLATEEGTAHEGKIQSFDNKLDRSSGTVRVRAVFPNEDGSLIPGLLARISLGSVAEENVMLISDLAVGTDQNRKFVLVVGESNKTEHREVKLGGMAEGLRIVDSGLKPGEKIIVSGMQRVMMPGQPVTPETVPMESAGKTAPDGAPAAKAEEAKPADPKPEVAPPATAAPESAPAAKPEDAVPQDSGKKETPTQPEKVK